MALFRISPIMRTRSLLTTAATVAAVTTSSFAPLLAAAEASSSSISAATTKSSSLSDKNQESTTCEYGYPLYRLRVLFIRHGESQNNVLYGQSPELYRKNRFPDPDLTNNGVQQATACGQYLSCHSSFADFNPIMGNVDAIYVSPMLRTLRTAQPIGKALNLEPQVWTDIYEISGLHINGVGHAGLSRAQILDKFPNYKLPTDVTDSGWYPTKRNKETRTMAITRIVGVANRLFEMAASCHANKQSRTIALVCHGDFKDMVLQALLGLDIPVDKKRRFLSYNTAITVVDVDVSYNDGGDEQRHATVMLQNFVGHLNSSLITHEALGIV